MLAKPPIQALAFLQNSYYGDAPSAEYMRKLFREYGDDYAKRAYVIGYGIFAGCKTGMRLRSTFGTRLCRKVIEWENASKFCGVNHSDKHGGADIDHMIAAINFWQPKAVLAFGRVAADAFRDVSLETERLIVGPHPARCESEELYRMRRELEQVIAI